MAYILFDFDGTICDSIGPSLMIYNNYLEKHHKKVITKSELRSVGVLEIAQKQQLARWKLFWIVLLARRYARIHFDEFTPIKGIEKELQKLSKRHTLGIVTSNSRGNVQRFLETHKLLLYFSFIESQMSYFGKGHKLIQVLDKYKITKTDCVYVGDETRDIKATKEARIKSVAVTWGFESQRLIKKSQPDITITKVSNLSKRVSQFFSKNN